MNTLPSLTARLIDEEASLTSTEDQESAFLASSNQKCDTKTKSKSEVKFGSRKVDVRKVTCYKCHKKGHFARSCRSVRKDEADQKPRQDNRTAFNVECNRIVHVIPEKNEDKWVMDCGASAHMSYRREYFSDFKEINEYDNVTVANKQGLPIKGIGTIKIEKFIDGDWYESTITNVLYIPDLSRNLFSEGVLAKNGLKIIKVNDSAEVFDGHRLVACAIRKTNNLYTMLFRTVVVTEANTVFTW